jgi:hypothetical protein
MTIFYRVSPYLSNHPNPLGNDKQNIVKTCYSSFKKCINGQKVVFILDDIEAPGDGQEIKAGPGNIETFHAQIDEICKLPNEEKVMFVEDDYLWREGAMDVIERGLDELDLISPYDHPGHYIEERFKNQPKRMRLIDGQVYREAPSNTLTFATHAWLIKQNADLIKSFGIRDHEMFTALPHDLYVPVPSLATHLVEGLLAPGGTWI